MQQKILLLLYTRPMLLLEVCFIAACLISFEKTLLINHVGSFPVTRVSSKKYANTYTDEKCKKTILILKATFNFILGHIPHDLQHDTVTEDPIPPALRLAMCLYCLASGVAWIVIHLFTLAPNGRQSMLVNINRLNVHAQGKSFFLDTTNGYFRDSNSHKNTFPKFTHLVWHGISTTFELLLYQSRDLVELALLHHIENFSSGIMWCTAEAQHMNWALIYYSSQLQFNLLKRLFVGCIFPLAK